MESGLPMTRETPCMIYLPSRNRGVWFAFASVVFIATLLILYCLYWTSALWEVADASTCKGHLKQLGVALEQYRMTYGSYPPAFIADSDGRRMHSWRALLLPYLIEGPIGYDYSEPWDSPENRRFAAEHTELLSRFRCPTDDASHQTWTSYVAVTGTATLWPGAECISLDDPEQEFGTLLVVELHESGIDWLDPHDLESVVGIRDLAFLRNRSHSEGMNFLTAGDSIGTLNDADSQIISQMAKRHGGTVVPAIVVIPVPPEKVIREAGQD